MILFLGFVCFAAGVVSALPLYTVFWWWDLFAHGLAGAAITLSMLISQYSKVKALATTLFISIAWEVVEPHIYILDIPIGFIVGDWLSDIIATVVGSLLLIGCFLIVERNNSKN